MKLNILATLARKKVLSEFLELQLQIDCYNVAIIGRIYKKYGNLGWGLSRGVEAEKAKIARIPFTKRRFKIIASANILGGGDRQRSFF